MALFETEEGGVFTALLHYPPPTEIITRSLRRFVLVLCDDETEPLLYVQQNTPAFHKRLTDILGNHNAAPPRY